MEEFKGTKGKWKLSTNQWGCVELDNKHIIACYANTDLKQYYESEIVEANANAKLIAAAPELLEACICALNFLKHIEEVENISFEEYNEVNIIKQAIQKALK